MSDVLPAFVDRSRKKSHQPKTCMNGGKSQRRDLGEALRSDSHVLGSMFLDYRLSKDDDAKAPRISGGTADGFKHYSGVPVVRAETSPKLPLESVHAMKMHFDRLWKDNQETVCRTSSGGKADAHHPASKRSGGTSEILVHSSLSVFQMIPREVLESICKLLPPFDLCRLCQVNRYLNEACSQDENWKSRAAENDISKTQENLSWKWNVLYAEQNLPCVRPLGTELVSMKGDWTIIDPFKLFFTSPDSSIPLASLQQQLQQFQQEDQWEFLVKYHGQIAYFISSESWDADAAFEITRDGMSLGFDELLSRFIAVVPKKLVHLLLEENGEDAKLEGGVSVINVDGQLIRSGDGDFVVSGSGIASRERKVSRWIEDDCVRNADILCAAGGKWTFCDDTSDEEEEYSESELET